MKPFHFVAHCVVACALILVAGCGSKQQQAEQQLEKLSEAAKQMEKSAEQMNQSLTGDRKPEPPVSFKVLIEFLPKNIDGLKAEPPTGESSAMGEWKFSNAKAEFSSEDGSKSVNVEINDFAYIQMLYMPYQLMLNMNYSRESTSGYERSTKIAGYPGFEKWEAESKNGEATVVVGQRFIVVVRTRGMDDGAAKTILQSIDLNSLSSQKAV